MVSTLSVVISRERTLPALCLNFFLVIYSLILFPLSLKKKTVKYKEILFSLHEVGADTILIMQGDTVGNGLN